MANELYSRKLSPEARAKLIDFLAAYIDTIAVERADARADIAKAKAIELLGTDIDILVFITTIMTFHSRDCLSLVRGCPPSRSREVASAIVEVSELAFEHDRLMRKGSREN